MKTITPSIFLAEDEDLVAKAYLFFFKREGFNVSYTKDGSQVVPCILSMSPPPDIILLDIVMPGVGGVENLQVLKSRKETKNIPIIVISNLSQQTEIDRCIKLGAVDYVIKSNTSAKELIDKIKKCVSSLNA